MRITQYKTTITSEDQNPVVTPKTDEIYVSVKTVGGGPYVFVEVATNNSPGVVQPDGVTTFINDEGLLEAKVGENNKEELENLEKLVLEIASEVDNKVEMSHLANKVYGTDARGNQTEYNLSSSAGAGKIVIYREDGRIKVVDGTSGSEVVNFRQLDKKQDKVNKITFEERTDSEQTTKIMNGRVRSYSAPSAVDSYWAGIEPTGLTLHYVKSNEQNEDGGAIYHWHLKYPEENEWSGDTDILNTPPKTSGTLATLTDVANEITKVVGGADTSYDTLKEIADWIKAHPNDVAALVSRISTLEDSKLDKVTSTASATRVYAVTSDGTQRTYPISAGVMIADAVVVRLKGNNAGQILVPLIPLEPGHASSKDYVDKRTPSLLFRGDLA